MLPTELIEVVVGHLDVASVCALSQTSQFWRESVSELVFQRKMQQVCPWFDPETSVYDSYKQCAFEYARRMEGLFVPDLKLVEESSFDYNSFYFRQLEPEQFTRLKRLAREKSIPGVYTSKHGIQVNLAGVDVWSAPDMQEVLSLPHMLAVIFIYVDDQSMMKGTLVVKYRTSDPANYEPDYVGTLPICLKYEVFACGSHCFVSTIDEETPQGEIVYDRLFYLHMKQNRLLPILDLKRNGNKYVVVYNGLFHYYSRRKLHSIQASLDNPTINQHAERPLKIQFCTYFGHPGYALVTHKLKKKKIYIWDMARNEIAPVPSNIKLPILHRYALHSGSYGCHDVTPFMGSKVPYLKCLDREEAAEAGVEPSTPIPIPFALFASLERHFPVPEHEVELSEEEAFWNQMHGHG